MGAQGKFRYVKHVGAQGAAQGKYGYIKDIGAQGLPWGPWGVHDT